MERPSDVAARSGTADTDWSDLVLTRTMSYLFRFGADKSKCEDLPAVHPCVTRETSASLSRLHRIEESERSGNPDPGRGVGSDAGRVSSPSFQWPTKPRRTETVDDTINWKPDPFGVHELRFFSADGKPTLLVMDSGKRSYDKPPTDQTESRPDGAQLESDPMTDGRPSPAVTQPAVLAAATSTSSTSEAAAQVRSDELPGETSPSEAGPIPSQQFTPTQTQPLAPPLPESATQPAQPGTSEVQRSFLVPGPRDLTAESLGSFTDSAPPPHQSLGVSAGEERERESEPMSHALKIAYGVVCGVLAVSALGVLFVHLHHSNGAHSMLAESSTSTTTATTTTSTTTSQPPNAPSTVSRLSPTAEAAANDLVTSWSMNNRLGALAVATPTAATTLFSTTYASGQAISRGCSTSFSPIVCTFGPPGGASPTDPIYQIRVSQAPGGWYVSSVRIEN